jgi:hypothetical protein
MKITHITLVETAGPAADNSDIMENIIENVRSGSSRIIANGKVVWMGIANNSGLKALLSKIKEFVRPGMEIQIQRFKTETIIKGC